MAENGVIFPWHCISRGQWLEAAQGHSSRHAMEKPMLSTLKKIVFLTFDSNVAGSIPDRHRPADTKEFETYPAPLCLTWKSLDD